MKTNQVLERKMGEFKVYQRTCDGMFNATELLKQWNGKSPSERKMDNFFNSQKTKEYVQVIMNREDLNTPKLVYLKRRGKFNGGTWMHPMLFIDFAMWINPEFKYDVIKFVYDQLIEYRNEAGDAYKEMATAICSIVDKSLIQEAMKKIAKGLNFVVYGSHEPGIRNKVGDESKAKELLELERDIAKSIKRGFIRDLDQCMDLLRYEYKAKLQMPKELA